MSNVTPLRPAPGIGEAAFAALQQLVNHEAEQALLGAILLNNRAYDAVCDSLSFDDFAHPLHGQIYATIGSILAGGGIANPITLQPYFAQEQQAAFGGNPGGYLANLALNAVTVIGAPFYAKAIRGLARRRQLIQAADAILADAALVDAEREVEAVLDDAEQRLHDIGENTLAGKPQPLSAIMPRTIEAIEAAYKRAKDGGSGAIVVDTGLAAVDRIIRGMSAGDLVVLAGRPAMGKTAAAGTIAVNVAAIGKVTAFFSLEMTAEQLAMRWVAGRTGIPTDKQRHGELDGLVDWPSLHEANEYISRLPIHIDDQPRLSVGQIRQRARRIRRRHGLDLVVVDHLQLMRQGGRQESRRTEIGDVTSSLKALAKELGVPILLLSQLNRALENRDDKRPTMADLKESGDIEQDADIIVFVHRDAYYLERAEPKRRPRQTDEAFDSELRDWHERCDEARGKADLIIAKNRQGRTGFAVCAFDAKRQRFETLERWER
jgi:replicative DNA helicase